MVFSDIAQKAFNGFTLSLSSSNHNNMTLATAPDGLTLEMVLQNQTSSPFSLQDFSEYLKLTYCNENLLFYQAVTEYKERCIAYFGLNEQESKLEPVLLSDGMTLFDFSESTRSVLSTREQLWFETLKSKFEIILQDFILSDAPQEINIPYEVRHQLLQSYQTQQLYHPALLYPACSAVVELLRISAFIPFATDPNRLLYCPMKKKKSFRKQKSIIEEEVIPPLPPTPTDIIPSASTGFLKRITTSFKIRYPTTTNTPTTNTAETSLDSPPMSPPRLSSWRQINMPDLSPFKNTPPTPTIEKSFAALSVTPPSSNSNNIMNQSSYLSTSSSSTSSDISTYSIKQQQQKNEDIIMKRTISSSSSTSTTAKPRPTTY